MAKQRVVVSERALYQRINRRLLRDGEMLRTSHPGSRVEEAYGRYFSVDLGRNQAARANINLLELGRELGVLAPWETVEA